MAVLNLNKRDGADEFLLGIAGAMLQHCEGNAALEWDTGGTVLLRRGDTVWIVDDPFVRRHLLAGDFRPAKLVVGLPPTSASPNTHRVGSAA